MKPNMYGLHSYISSNPSLHITWTIAQPCHPAMAAPAAADHRPGWAGIHPLHQDPRQRLRSCLQSHPKIWGKPFLFPNFCCNLYSRYWHEQNKNFATRHKFTFLFHFYRVINNLKNVTCYRRSWSRSRIAEFSSGSILARSLSRNRPKLLCSATLRVRLLLLRLIHDKKISAYPPAATMGE